MSCVLIDANKYLDLYKSEKIRKVLPLLIDLGANLFITKQIVDEVCRNRVSVATQFLKQAWQHKEPLRYSFPDHLMACEAEVLKALTNQTNQLNVESKKLFRDVQSVLSASVKAIIEGKDNVSSQLDTLFRNPVVPTVEQLNLARLRKECGNPPGKKTDPLGDQLSWEQFLASFNQAKTVWVITGDGDYLEQDFDGGISLNPILQSDLSARAAAHVEARCFKTLVDGLKDALDTLRVQSKETLPAEVVNEIRDEELALNSSTVKKCPICGGSLSFRRYSGGNGHIVERVVCRQCKARGPSPEELKPQKFYL